MAKDWVQTLLDATWVECIPVKSDNPFFKVSGVVDVSRYRHEASEWVDISNDITNRLGFPLVKSPHYLSIGDSFLVWVLSLCIDGHARLYADGVEVQVPTFTWMKWRELGAK